MSSLSRKMQRAAQKNRLSKPSPPNSLKLEVTDPGIFCDCYGTLYSHSFEKDETLVNYLNAKFAAGTEVMLLSTDPSQVFPHIRNIGLNDQIVFSLIDKRACYNRVLETLIDDDPVNLEAAKIWNPKDSLFRRMMEEYLSAQVKNPSPHPDP